MAKPVSGFLGRLQLRSEESFHLFRFGVAVFLLGLATSAGSVLAESLLLGRVGSGALPRAFVAQQMLVLAASIAYLRWGRDARADFPFVALGGLAFVGSTASGALLGHEEWLTRRGIDVSWTLIGLVAVVQTVGTLALTHFHNVRGLLMDAVTTKRILARILSCFVGGKLVGGLISIPCRRLPMEWWGPVYGLLALMATAALAWIFRGMNTPPPPGGTLPGSGLRGLGWSAMASHPFFRWAMAASFFGVITERCLELTAGFNLAQHHSPQQLADILGPFTVVSSLLAGLVQIFAVSPLVNRVGPARASSLYPLLSLGAVAVSMTSASPLVAGLVARFAFAFLPPATVDTTYGLLEGGLPVRHARNIRVLKSGFVRPLATLIVASGVIVWVLPTPAHGALIAALILGGLSLLAPALYARTWIELIRNRGTSRGDLRSFRPPTEDSVLWPEVTHALVHSDDEFAEAALELVEGSGGRCAVLAATTALSEVTQPIRRARMIEVLGRLGWRPDATFLRGLSQQAPVVRAEVYLMRDLMADSLEALAESEITRSEKSFARVAAAGHRLASQPHRKDLVAIICSAISDSHPSRAALGLRAAYRSRHPAFVEAVEKASRVAVERVRRASVGALWVLGRKERLQELALTDTHARIRAAALAALRRVDPAGALLIAPRMLGDASGRVRLAATELVLEGGARTLRIVKRLARDASVRWSLREECLQVWADSAPRSRFNEVVARIAIRRALARHETLMRIPPRCPSVGVLLARAFLQDGVIVSFYIATRSLTIRMGEAFFDTVMEGLRARAPNVRSQSLEGLSARLPSGLPDGMIDLVKDTGYLARLYIGSSMAGHPLDTPGSKATDWTDGLVWLPEGAELEPTDDPESQGTLAGISRPEAVETARILRPWLEQSDPYLAAALAWALRDLEGRVPEGVPHRDHPLVAETLAWLNSPAYPGSMSTLARIAFLKGTEFFVGFGAEELHLLAQVAHPERFGPGEPLFRQGERADELFILMRGEVDVLLEKDGKQIHIGRCGPEEVVGEMGIFDGHPRSATVQAVKDTEALSISRGDLTEVLAQSPAVGMAFLRALSGRLRRVTNNIAASPPPRSDS